MLLIGSDSSDMLPVPAPVIPMNKEWGRQSGNRSSGREPYPRSVLYSTCLSREHAMLLCIIESPMHFHFHRHRYECSSEDTFARRSMKALPSVSIASCWRSGTELLATRRSRV